MHSSHPPRLLKHSRKVFSADEDKRLSALVGSFGNRSWDIVARYMPNRTARQCRDRWKFYVCPSVNRAPWTPEEDQLLFAKYGEVGGKWSVLCQFFENRSLNNVKNRWNSVTRKVHALKLDANSLGDFLYCANLITQPTTPERLSSPSEREIPEADPLSIFQIARLLNPPKED
jgi:hypothetical protein